MADIVDDKREFKEGRVNTCESLGMSEDTVKSALRQIIAKGYAEEVHPAIKGKRNRCIKLLPDNWPAPRSTKSERGAAKVRAELDQAAARKAAASAPAQPGRITPP